MLSSSCCNFQFYTYFQDLFMFLFSGNIDILFMNKTTFQYYTKPGFFFNFLIFRGCLFNPLSARKSKVKVTLCQCVASPSFITFQFHPLVVSLSDRKVFYELISTHLALKGLKGIIRREIKHLM